MDGYNADLRSVAGGFYGAEWRMWVRPMVKRRRRCHAEMRRWRDSCLKRPWGGWSRGRRLYKHKPKGLRLWRSLRYADARARS